MSPYPDKNPYGRADQGEEPTYTPYLNIRYDQMDTGNRPLAPNTVFWCSPDILFSPTDAYGNVIEGSSVTLTAHVLNWGMSPGVAVNVEFYWCNPALGVSPANGHLIGSKLVTVPGMNYVDVVCPSLWKPTFENGGHECLIVQCTCPQDPMTAPFMPALDRHVGQRNIMVVPAGQGQKAQIAVSNIFGKDAQFTIQATTTMVSTGVTEWEPGQIQNFLMILPHLATPGRAPARFERMLRLRFSDSTARIEGIRITNIMDAEVRRRNQNPIDLERYIEARRRADPDHQSQRLGRVIQEFMLAPRAMKIIDFDILPARLRVGQFMVYKIVQAVAGLEVGGYTFIVSSIKLGDH